MFPPSLAAIISPGACPVAWYPRHGDGTVAPQGMGIKRAHKFIKECKCFARACKQIRYAGIPMPQGYEAACQVAVWTFQHQRVYCPRRRVIVHLNPMPDGALQVDPEFK